MSSSGPGARTAASTIARTCLGLRSRRLGRLVARLYDDALRPYGLTSAQLNILVMIALAGPVAAAEVGRELDLEKSTLSRNLRRMIDNGWVRDDRALVLTAAGERLLVEAKPAWDAAQREARARLGDDAIAMLEELTKGVRGG